MEHLNRICKGSIAALGSNVTEKSVKQIGKSLGELTKVEQAFEDENGIRRESGKHQKKSEKEDIQRILEGLNTMEVFISKQGREHLHFPNFVANSANLIDNANFNLWMEQQLKELI